MEQMPLVTRSDCTQVDVTEDWEVSYSPEGGMVGTVTKVDIDFNACQGRNNRNNDLFAMVARLYDEGKVTARDFGKVGQVLTNDHDCYYGTEYAKQKKGFVTGYTHDASVWTQVAGRDELEHDVFGKNAFNTAFFEETLTKDTTPISEFLKFHLFFQSSETPPLQCNLTILPLSLCSHASLPRLRQHAQAHLLQTPDAHR